MKRIWLKRLSYRNKVLFIVASAVISLIALYVSDRLAKELERKEKHLINLWSMSVDKTGDLPSRDYKAELEELLQVIIAGSDDIPRIVTDQNLNVMGSKDVPESVLEDSDKTMKLIKKMANDNKPIEIKSYNGMYITYRYVFYGNSSTIDMLRFFPMISIMIVLVYVAFSYITYSSTKRDEQNKVWIGMAKETAHQLGTPTSSLLGWVEYLNSHNVEPMVIDEMTKDIDRLLTVVDRFSKIGSETTLSLQSVNDVVAKTVNYFTPRLPKKVSLTYVAEEGKDFISNTNEVLYGWVIENLLRNAIDALSGSGDIEVSLYEDKKWIYADVKDNGKGIAPANIEKIFKPGFTTKSRGWGLGLSLCARIIENYHKGRIFVANSELNKGTTIRVMIKKYENRGVVKK